MADGVVPLTKLLRQPDARAMAAAVAALSNLVPGNTSNQAAVRRARVYVLLIRAAAAHHGQPVAHNALKVRARTIQTGALVSGRFVLRTRGLAAGLKPPSHAHSHLASHATSTDPAVAALSPQRRRRMRSGLCLARSCGARSRSWRRRRRRCAPRSSGRRYGCAWSSKRGWPPGKQPKIRGMVSEAAVVGASAPPARLRA